MATFSKGDMLQSLDLCDAAFITTNAFIKKNGELVMGRGIAQQVRDSFRGIAKDLGNQIKTKYNSKESTYGIIQAERFPKLWAFQVKYNWFEDADLSLIEFSTDMLRNLAINNPKKTYFLNYPGIGNGHLDEKDVLPLIMHLPDNVTIWKL